MNVVSIAQKFLGDFLQKVAKEKKESVFCSPFLL